ncbi:RraA family protein [Myceligenerans pegani]|uniref:Putative 4-hydroxy-4-methyl-2-oxoglutarate aldolase n=1 Tax=Myceligenerans pegani TaxID=2776917 RepID=A0ABR9MXF8_9MICO|nr:RraA family protein [Myceligenerans sp. TRM 65318]MBE1876073.1 RraA family protein [Myceligenerans sp. TRM 65318]MBE3018344.1 RraA family protein [Myceligenerans sp. TRM 65318]
MTTDARTLTDTELDFLAGVDSPTIANAVERLELRDRGTGYVGGRVRCDFPELGTMVGRALTVTVSDAIGRPARQDGYWELWERLDAMTGPVVIIMKDASTTPSRVAYAGEIMATLGQRLGAVGFVTDGALRDVAEVRAKGIHYFSRYTVASHANFELTRVGDPVLLDGERIATGDILHGDANGLVVVPWDALADLPAAVERVRDGEARDLAYIEGPDFTLAGYRRQRTYGTADAGPAAPAR